MLLEPIYRSSPWVPDTAQSRGLVTASLMVEGVNYAIQGVRQLIEKSNEAYSTEYMAAVSNLKFYAVNSDRGALDPYGLQLEGFVLTRTFVDEHGQEKEAFRMHISLQEERFPDLLQNAKYYLKLDSALFNCAGVKINKRDWYLPWTWFIRSHPFIDMDVYLDILVNWIDDKGQIHSGVPYGSFVLPLRKIPLEATELDKELFARSLRNTELQGSAYTAPRSSVFCQDQNGLKPCFGRGDVACIARVIESSQESLVNRLVVKNVDGLQEIKIKEDDLKKILKNGWR